MFNRLTQLVLVMLFVAVSQSFAFAGDYAVVVSKATSEDAAWKPVVAALVKKHNATVIVYDSSVVDSLGKLIQLHPRYTCFVAKSSEAGREFVRYVHLLTRKYDSDPYTDTRWGILTGYDAANALDIARYAKPLVVRKVASATDVAFEMCEDVVQYDELVKNKMVRKEKGGPVKKMQGPDDTTQALADTLNKYQADLFITSGHATERDWMIGFRYRNGYFKSKAGQMYGEDTKKNRIEIDSKNPKVYLPIGNCLMGHINGPDAMALAWMNDVGVKQMIGYTIPTGYGYGGWGCLDYFVEQPGRYTFAEAFLANHHALIHRLGTYFEKGASGKLAVNEAGKAIGLTRRDTYGLRGDRDRVAFYGDPKWQAIMADAKKAYGQTLTVNGDIYTLTITPNRGADSFKPVNTNGSQRGGRPMIQFLDHRIQTVKIITGQDLKPVITDDFILVPNPGKCDTSRKYVIKFKATRIPAGKVDVATKELETDNLQWPAHVKKKLYAKNDLRGKPAPKLEVGQWLSDQPDTKGKIVVVDFWATWCGPCRALIPHMNEMQKKFKKDVVFIGLSSEKAEKVLKFMENTKIDYTMALDSKKRMSKAVGVQGIPHVLVIDTKGIVRWQGFPSGSEKLTDKVIEQIINMDKQVNR